MDRWDWVRTASAITLAIGVAGGSSWLATQLVNSDYPGQPSYKPDGLGAPIDLAQLQRSWPSGLSTPGDDNRLSGYMSAVAKGTAPHPAPAGPVAAAPALPPPDLGTLLARADAAKGQASARVCVSCHSFQQGGANGIGPNLWAIVGRTVGREPGFAYSQALAVQQGSWSYERLDHWLMSPARAVPGNKMGFAGIRNPQDRANVLAYLGQLGAAPAPFPPPQPATAAAGGRAAKPGR